MPKVLKKAIINENKNKKNKSDLKKIKIKGLENKKNSYFPMVLKLCFVEDLIFS